MVEDLTEERLSRTLKALSAQAIPDEQVDVSDLIDWDPLRTSVYSIIPTSGLEKGTSLRRNRMHRGARGLAVAVAVLSLTGVGAGIAAATGVFTRYGHSPTSQEKRNAAIGTTLIASARGQLSPSGQWTAANVQTRLTEPGPDGSTIILQTSSSNAYDGCLHLLVTDRTQPQHRGVVTCWESYTAAAPPTTAAPSTNFGSGATTWASPSGVSYWVLFGQAPLGTTSAKLINVSTETVITESVPIFGRFYADPILRSESHRHDELAFYDATGNKVGAAAP